MCQHPIGRRRTYRVANGGTTAECEVCWTCAAVRSQAGGWWKPMAFTYAKPDLLELDGRVRIPNYFDWCKRAPVAH